MTKKQEALKLKDMIYIERKVEICTHDNCTVDFSFLGKYDNDVCKFLYGRHFLRYCNILFYS